MFLRTNSKKRVFQAKDRTDEERVNKIEGRIAEHANAVRLFARTQMTKKLRNLRQKKTHVLEIQVKPFVSDNINGNVVTSSDENFKISHQYLILSPHFGCGVRK